ncbi:MAG: glutamine synthetase family protein [Bacteroidales bacterium]|jgi:glutamine synthetase|nr:glutamine synthetase family protein [Bacteroidales bacterium]
MTTLHPLVQYFNKPSKDFTKQDLLRYIKEKHVEMINFRYVAGDGRLKTLNFVLHNENYTNEILSCGERVDGSSLFRNIDAGASDLYVIPRYSTTYINPFSEISTLDVLCSFYDKDGNPFQNDPAMVMRRAANVFKDKTGFEFECMGELEYYVIGKKDDLFYTEDQRGYHESSPFTKFEQFRKEAMRMMTSCGCLIKYGHSEVGNFTLNDYVYEQNEIEFLPTAMIDAADQLVLAKWILRTLAVKYNVSVTFSPKITVGKAGSGMHIHTRLMKDGKNVMLENGKLSDTAKKAIAGYLDIAPSLSAFGNTNPMSYFRLVPHQEAPTNICWGDRNRSALVRVPLGWDISKNMAVDANPAEPQKDAIYDNKQTVEFRSPDGSANIYLLVAGLCVAARHGLEMQNALEYARERYISVNIFAEENKGIEYKQLPASCDEAADCLEKQRTAYEKYDVFSPALIDATLDSLRSYYDKHLRKEVENRPQELLRLVEFYLHCG